MCREAAWFQQTRYTGTLRGMITSNSLKAVNKNMRLSKLALFAALLSPGLVATAFAQHGGGGHGGGGGGHAGGGSVGHSGGGFSGGSVRGGSVGAFHGGSVSGFHGGSAGAFHGGHGYWYGGHFYGGTGVYFGFGGYPYYGYGYGYPYYGYGYAPYAYGYPPYAYDGGYAAAPASQQDYGYQSYPPQGAPQQNYPQQAYPQGQEQVGPPPGAPQQSQPQAASQGAPALAISNPACARWKAISSTGRIATTRNTTLRYRKWTSPSVSRSTATAAWISRSPNRPAVREVSL